MAGEPRPRVPPVLVRSLSVRRSIPRRGGTRARPLLGRRGVSGLLSSIGPVAVGVILAFAWNIATTQQQEVAASGSGVTPEVRVAVDQAAAQAWASSTPDTATGSSARSPHGSTRPAREHSHRHGTPADGCSRVNPTAFSAPRSVIATRRSGTPGDATVPGAGSGDPRNTRRPGPVHVTVSACQPRPRFRAAQKTQPNVFASIATAPTNAGAVTQGRPARAARRAAARYDRAAHAQSLS